MNSILLKESSQAGFKEIWIFLNSLLIRSLIPPWLKFQPKWTMFHLCHGERFMRRLRAKEKNWQRRNNTRGCNKVVRRLAELHSSLQLARTSSSRKNPPDGELGQRCSPVGQCSGSRNSALLNYASIRFARGARKNPCRVFPLHAGNPARACVRASDLDRRG